MEVWKNVGEFPDLFQVSNYGRVWSKRTSKILIPTKTKSGYLTISTKIGGRNGKYISRRIHRWVVDAFISNPEDKPFVNHKDGIKTNNHIDNLEWVTAKENSVHSYDMGLQVAKKGVDVTTSKLTEEDVRFIKANHIPRCKEFGCSALARRFGVVHQTISRIVNGKMWAHIV